MLKNIFRLVLGMMLLVAPGLLRAQENPMMQPLPLMQNVKTGVLPNGLTYYILHNEEPKGRANFYIAQKVGSSLENPEQLGLAHFLEHMAFNGTTNFPGKNMLNYLQSKSLRFGADINAYTSFDETVYNINNVPTSDVALMDSVLLALHDWSCAITLDGEEIDAERKVIQEEWRSRDGASNRFYTKMLPAMFAEYQYQQMPIGKMEVVMNFPHNALRDYYAKWYRPDQQGIVIVGDFDAAAMEEMVKKVFGTIKMPENAAPRLYPAVSDNEKPLYFEYADPEAPTSIVFVAFKQKDTPREEKNTLGWKLEDFIQDLVTLMLDNRLQEFAQTAECAYTNAGVYFGDYWVSGRDAFNIQVQPKDNVQLATRQAMEIISRACLTGFTDSEYQRAKDELRSQIENRVNEKDKTQNGILANRLIRHFIDNTALPDPQVEMQLFDMIIPQVQVGMINEEVKGILTDTNQAISVFMPEKEGTQLPGEQAMVSTINQALHKQYEAYVDEVITEPLIAKLPKPGTIKNTTQNNTYGTTEFTLSNGVKVILKTTDFAADEIRMVAVAKGGNEAWNPADYVTLNMIETAMSASKLGTFNNTTLNKYLSGKQVRVSSSIGAQTYNLSGFSTKKDFQTMMEIAYSYFTQLNPDPEQYAIDVKKIITKIEQKANDPMTAFSDSLQMALYCGDLRYRSETPASVKAADYATCLAAGKKILSNAADFTFIFVGNIDEATLRPMLEQYVATLPSKGKPSKAGKIYPIPFAKGNTTVAFEKPMGNPATIYYSFTSGNAAIDAVNEVNVDIAGDILGNLFTEIIREKEGAAYSPGAAGQLNDVAKRWQIIRVIQTNSEQQKRAFELADQELAQMLKGEITADQFNKVKSAAVNQFDIQLRKNAFWINTLRDIVLGTDTYTGQQQVLQNLTLESFKAWIKNLKPENCTTVIMTGVPANK